MGIMDNEGHDPMGFGNVRSARAMQADPDPHAALKEARAEIERLQEQLSHAAPAIDELTMEREDYKSRWLGSMTPEEAALIRAENERLRNEVKQCSVELGEAAKLLAPHYPRTSGIYEEACGRARIAIGLTPCDVEQKLDSTSRAHIAFGDKIVGESED